MFYNITLYLALAIFGLGLVYKISNWFRYQLGMEAVDLPSSTRVSAAVKGITSTLFSLKIFTLLKVFILDVVLQIRILRQDFLRWLIHICLYGGFMLLLLMHALDNFVTSILFPDYYSTLNPFMFLRDLFGAMVILGLALALYRRFILKVPRLATTARDSYAIIMLAVIVVSGIFLESIKIVSYSKYQEMVQDYSDLEEADKIAALEAFWAKEFEIVSPHIKRPFDSQTLEKGRKLHEMNCAGCHSKPQWAFMGYGLAKAIKPVALSLDRANIHTLVWYIHFLACFFALAYLPFSKFFHIFASPLSLLANAVMDKEKSNQANILTKQAIELDACTHCGTCSLQCSVAVVLEQIPNVNILPSEKVATLRAIAAGRELSERELRIIQEGVYLCTNCDRCTALCPVGINLKDLWLNMRVYLAQKGYPEPMVWAREAISKEYNLIKVQNKAPLSLTLPDIRFQNEATLSLQAKTYSVCFGCENCTTVCPVVGNYDNPREALGLLPHQIMQSVGLGLRGLAFGSKMLWECLTCYQCQEHCPQGVCVTDVLYELKNLAFRYLKEKTR